ncbi:LacI family DNA-binding transcriptional regulator [Ktedonobacter sp. SOSP1-52]|nr:LacI family DNA-binding transcriptional regulator [Ktedonobacter sp. SOSP1-52]
MDSRSPVALADIAEAAHVSVGTVSRVLNGR